MRTAQPSNFTGPYRGLEPFDEASADFFFGRERETRLVTASLFASPLTLLYGDSGVGKSSVLRAGVVRQLRQRDDVLPVVFPRFASNGGKASAIERGWQTDPVSGIKETIALELFASAGDNAQKARDYRNLVSIQDMTPLAGFVEEISKHTGRTVMVILDQFEEYSLYHPDEDLFAVQFPRAIAAHNGAAAFLVSLRGDALSRLDRFKGTIPTLWDSYRRIDHLDGKAAEDAVRLPLEEYNRRLAPGETPVSIEAALVHRVLREVRSQVTFEGSGTGALTPQTDGGRIETPYLQLVMTRLWERERAEGSSTLRLVTLQSEGGAPTIVSTHLDRVMEQFTTKERDVAAAIFHRLVTPSGTKIAFSVQDLAEYEKLEVSVIAPILLRLEEGQRRILRRVAAPDDGKTGPRYEIFHDRLGKAILSWRARWLAAQAREQSRLQEEEQRRLAEQSRAALRKQVLDAMHSLSDEDRATWASIMFYLVSSDGTRLVCAIDSLASAAKQPVKALHTLLEQLVLKGILRRAYAGPEHDAGDWYEVVHDAMAAALLEWQAAYVRQHATKTRAGVKPVAGTEFGAPEVDPAQPFPYGIIRHSFAKGEIIAFLGAGASMSGPGSPPAANQLKEEMASYIRFPPTEYEQSDLSEIASYFEQQAGAEAVRRFLNQKLGGSFSPSATHTYLAELARTAPLIILTTNFDSLMEQALAAAAVPFSVVGYVPVEQDERDRVAYVGPGMRGASWIGASQVSLRPDITTVVKLYGAVHVPGEAPTPYVVTEEDHIEWIMRLRARSSMLPPLVEEALEHRHLLSLGHSARDWSQRALLRLLHTSVHRRQVHTWAVALRPSPLSIMTWQRYGVKVYNADLNDWVAQMRAAV